MTLSASTIALSLIALKISETPSQTELIKMSWVSLLVSLALGFVSIVLDYNVTARAERDAQVLSKLAAGIVDEETIEIAEKNREWFKKMGSYIRANRRLVRVHRSLGFWSRDHTAHGICLGKYLDVKNPPLSANWRTYE